MKSRSIALSVLLLAGIACVSHAQTAKPGPLRAGAAKVDVTPSPRNLPSNYSGILDPVYARAIVVDNGSTSAALVTVDVISLSDAVWTRVSGRIQGELAIPVRNLVLSGSSTHTSPITGGGQPGPVTGNTGSQVSALEDKIVECVRLAKERLQPARMSFGKGVSYINVNRENIDPKTHQWWEGANYDGVSDKEVRVVKFSAMNGDPIAVYFNYAVFNVIAGTLGLVSGDVTGATSQYVEDSYDNKMVAVLSLGAHADQNPIYFQQTFDLREIQVKYYAAQGKDYSNAVPPMEGLDRKNPTVMRLEKQQKQMVLSMGQMLGEEVLHAMRSATRERSNVGIYGDQRTVSCPGRERTNEGRSGVAGTYKDAPPVDLRLGVLMIGDVAIGEVNGNPYAQIGLRLKKESPYANTILTSRANGTARGAYIPDDASFGHQMFAVLNATLQPGCAESAIVNGIIDMMPPILY